MKKTAFLLFFALIISNVYSGDKSWYKFFTGNINSSGINMSIVKYDDQVRGFYYYDNSNKPVDIYGIVIGDSLKLDAYLSPETTLSINGVLRGDTYSGVWSKTPDNAGTVFTMIADKKRSSEFEYVFVKGEERLFKDLESPMATYTEGTFWPTDNYENSLFVRNAILKMKNMKTGLTEIGALMLANKKRFMSGFREQNAELKRDEVADGGWCYSLDNVDIMAPVFFNEQLFVLSNYNYTYTGGAHGNYGTAYINLDLKRKRVITIDDIMFKKDSEKISKLLEKYYKLERGIPQEQSLMEAGLFVDTIPLNDNFMITPGNFMFSYVPYEISSYAEGEITISIPYSEISAFIKPEAKVFFK